MNEDLVYIDESGIDDNEFYKYGWSEKGKRLFDNKPAYKIKRMSIIGSLNKGKLKALWAFEGHCNSKIFESYVKNILIPVLKRGQIIVLDNATFHKSKLTQQLIENAGCKLLFLPPYSPNLNQIEHFWFAIKHNIRKILVMFSNLCNLQK
ncbi:IS630 family transposase [Spiroplasma ixodetis]|uniref:Tc1-like transposase DDE domain-containing protein n=1 Tax=Spiroplasma ixodetis TaxID=2141 RepID=A0ABM8JRS8_9MOLU